MSCLVPQGGHTKMDAILTYWQQLTFQIRWEELLWRSHLSRWRWIWIQAITRNSSLRDYAIREVPAQSKPVWMYQWCPTWMNQPSAWTHVLTVWASHWSGCINNAPALYEPHKGNDRVCANSQVKYRILHTSTCLQRWNKDEKRLQSRHASAAHTKLRHSVEGIAGLEGHRDSWDDC